MSLSYAIEKIVDVPNFPKQGITFKDITPLLADAKAFSAVTDEFAKYITEDVTQIIGIESRGFIFGAALAQKTGIGLSLARKPGKLPRETYKQSYELEYGTDNLEIHKDAIGPGDTVLIIDDVLATGGTAQAVEKLCLQTGASVKLNCFLMEIEFLKGSSKLQSPYVALMQV